ncbi:MAG: hypothetical protein CVT89_08530 [Candidatus Altiarchaeales archaeon HGW-Altiarchaeales-2]|nr:MAG: hypothetical protein CVT89_08530 [Candidatus Altiarchaeales archaeon HGW-Altiarchaeales-2]
MNDNNNCSSTVKLNQSITNQAGSCIYNPLNWTNKIFDCQGNTIDGDKNRTYYNNKIPIVIEVFTRDGCPICYHVDEGAKKLADEYNEKNKNSVILLKYHLQDTLATQAGLDRRIFYHGDKWWNVCNYYELCAI